MAVIVFVLLSPCAFASAVHNSTNGTTNHSTNWTTPAPGRTGAPLPWHYTGSSSISETMTVSQSLDTNWSTGAPLPWNNNTNGTTNNTTPAPGHTGAPLPWNNNTNGTTNHTTNWTTPAPGRTGAPLPWNNNTNGTTNHTTNWTTPAPGRTGAPLPWHYTASSSISAEPEVTVSESINPVSTPSPRRTGAPLPWHNNTNGTTNHTTNWTTPAPGRTGAPLPWHNNTNGTTNHTTNWTTPAPGRTGAPLPWHYTASSSISETITVSESINPVLTPSPRRTGAPYPTLPVTRPPPRHNESSSVLVFSALYNSLTPSTPEQFKTVISNLSGAPTSAITVRTFHEQAVYPQHRRNQKKRRALGALSSSTLPTTASPRGGSMIRYIYVVGWSFDGPITIEYTTKMKNHSSADLLNFGIEHLEYQFVDLSVTQTVLPPTPTDAAVAMKFSARLSNPEVFSVATFVDKLSAAVTISKTDIVVTISNDVIEFHFSGPQAVAASTKVQQLLAEESGHEAFFAKLGLTNLRASPIDTPAQPPGTSLFDNKLTLTYIIAGCVTALVIVSAILGIVLYRRRRSNRRDVDEDYYEEDHGQSTTTHKMVQEFQSFSPEAVVGMAHPESPERPTNANGAHVVVVNAPTPPLKEEGTDQRRTSIDDIMQNV